MTPTSRYSRSLVPISDTQDTNGTTVETIYAFNEFPPNLSTEHDINQYDRIHGLGDSKVAVVMASFPPGAETPMHRTMTVNIGIVLEGTVELHLDSGEARVLKAGDSYTQRGTMHKWKNPGEGWVRMTTFTVPIVEPFEINGRNMGSESPWFRTLQETLSSTTR